MLSSIYMRRSGETVGTQVKPLCFCEDQTCTDVLPPEIMPQIPPVNVVSEVV